MDNLLSMMDRESSPDPVSVPTVLGSLYYIDRKSGEIKQHYPIDAEKITFGRDPDCDIRLHWDDVSRVHAEIQFNEGIATLVVIGAAGLYFVPPTQPRVRLDSTSRQTLNNGDGFIIRKKLFRFEYPAEDMVSTSNLSASILNTPIRGAATPKKQSSAPTPLRRRASHRLSLMPADKPFVPLSPMKRRQSMSAQAGTTPKKSHLSRAVEEEEQEEEEIMEGIVDVQQNEEGDLIILETRQETPVVLEKSTVPPKTPRSIPLPPPSQTPYVQTPPRVSTKVAMSTPPGPMTLHKALLLRSARKAWVESRPNDVDDAVADGKIETTRRKSKSPSKEDGPEMKRKSLTPMKSIVPEPDSDMSSEDEEEAEVAAIPEREELGLNVDVRVDASFVEGNSVDEDLEADMSLDVPGQEAHAVDSAEMDENAKGEDSYEEEVEEEEGEEEEEEEAMNYDHEEHVNEQDIAEHEMEDMNDASDRSEDEENDDMFARTPAKHTPINSRALDRFYTPQVPRQQNQPRRSLANFGGPATRVLGVPASPNPLGGGAFRPTPANATPGRLPASYEDDGEEEEQEEEKPILKSSISDRELAEIKRRRQSLATPRQLPAAPMSFRDPVKSAFSLLKTPNHPALTRSPTKDADDEHDDTPIGDIRSRLSKMKRESTARELSKPSERNGRRATVGFVLPETPARPTIQASASYTAAPSARFGGVAPPTPENNENAHGEEKDIGTYAVPVTPLRSAIKKVGTPFSLIRRTPIQEEESSTTPPGSPPTIIKSSHRSTPTREPKPIPKTPYMGDIRNLYPTIPNPPSPILSGIKNLYPTLPLPPKTPDMRGVKAMYADAGRSAAGKTPGMEGMAEMFASPARNSPARGQKEIRDVLEDEIAAQSSPRRKRRSSAAPKAANEEVETEQMGQEAVEGENEEVAEVQVERSTRKSPSKSIPLRSLPPSSEVEAEPIKSAPTRASRTIKPPVPSSKTTSTRTRAAASVTEEVVEAEAKVTSTRRRAAPAASAIPVPSVADTRSKPSRSAPAAIELPVAPTKSTRSRIPSAKLPTKAPSTIAPSSPEAKSAPSLRGRPKKVLAETADQPIEAITKPAATVVPKPARTRAVPEVVERRTVSAPTRRTRAVKEDEGEKENVAEEKSLPTRTTKARGVKKDVAVGPVSAPARATRSRK